MKKIAIIALIIALVTALSAALCGCAWNKYTGSSTTVGEQTALPEFSSTSGDVTVRIFESIKGARVYTAKDSKVKIEYQNAYTNTYFGIFDTQDTMKLKVLVEPLDMTPSNPESAAE